ncbi:MAG: NADH-quinone oxidoreductase subunit C [Deltaproteobacteria bacterium]|nr:NADH-quinone oxidoreductase subunit C [Deltaproteobacteria bacterium]
MSKLLLDRLKAQFGDSVLETSNFRGDDVAVLDPKVWRAAAEFLRDDNRCGCDYFVDLSCVDYPDEDDTKGRFDVYLIVYSTHKKHRVRIKARVSEANPELDTVGDIYLGASWGEREVFDMFGVRFKGHPDLRRILMYEEFVGYPLRKDYPATKAQPLVEYRDNTHDKLGPFLADEGMPFNRAPVDPKNFAS